VLRASGAAPAGELGRRAVGLFLLGPMLGVFSGWVAITLLDQVRRRVGVRRDYESLYALGVAFTAFAAAEAVGGSGFLAAFAAGLVIAALDVELCDCFLDYGEASAEMFLLLTFVAFGAGLIWTGVSLAGDWRVLVFAAVALGVRTAVLVPVLARAGIEPGSCRLIALFGPRGLSSLLLVLLPVFAGIPGAERLFTITCLVVLLSVVIHGGGIALYLRRHGGAAAGAPMPAASATPRPSLADTAAHATPRPSLADTAAHPTTRVTPRASSPRQPAAVTAGGDEVPERITIQEFRDLHRSGEPVIVGDVRTERSYRDDPNIGIGAIRLPPDDAVRLARERRLDPNATLVLYCA
jgi:sodium/hydrogen antiporter